MPTFGTLIEQSGLEVVVSFTSHEVTDPQMQSLMADLTDRMRYDNASTFVFDMGEVEFMASACLGTLVQFLQDIAPMRGRMAIANCRDNILFLFKVTRLDAVFEVYDDLADAREGRDIKRRA